MKRSILLFLSLLLMAGCSANPQNINNRGNRAFERQEYENALRDYLLAQAALSEAPEPGYNAANTHYRQGDLIAASERMRASVLRMSASQEQLSQSLPADEMALLEDSHYNLGNILYRMEAYVDAVESYKAALRLDPGDTDAKHNLELALQMLEKIPTEQPPPQTGEQNQPTPLSEQAEPTPPGIESTPAAPAPTLSPEQARQLLEMAGEAAQTLQEYLQQPFPAQGNPPAQDW